MTNNKSLPIIVVLSGLCLGWVASSMVNQVGAPIDGPVPPANEVINRGYVKSERALGVGVDSANKKVDEIDAHGSGEFSSRKARLLELAFENVDDHQLTVDRIIDYFNLVWGEGRERILTQKEIRGLIRDNPEISFKLLDRLFDIEDDRVKIKLEMLFMMNNSSQRPFLEPAVMERIKRDERRSEWLRVLGSWGLQSKSNIGYLINEMPYFENPKDVGASIRAITNSSWARSSALSPNEHQEISEIVRANHASEHAEIRAASIAALRVFPQADFQERVIAGLKDSAKIVRDEANSLYRDNPFPSTEAEEILNGGSE